MISESERLADLLSPLGRPTPTDRPKNRWIHILIRLFFKQKKTKVLNLTVAPKDDSDETVAKINNKEFNPNPDRYKKLAVCD